MRARDTQAKIHARAGPRDPARASSRGVAGQTRAQVQVQRRAHHPRAVASRGGRDAAQLVRAAGERMSGRIRSIKPEWLEDEAMLSCSAEARVITNGLILLADDHGRGRGSVVYLSSRIFPVAESTRTLANGLAELVKIRFVELYRLDGQTYYSIRNWTKHQRV